jgi:hypothetical protein
LPLPGIAAGGVDADRRVHRLGGGRDRQGRDSFYSNLQFFMMN